MSNEKAKAYWDKNEQALKDVGRFEGPKGVVYQVFRDMEVSHTAPQAHGLNFDLTYPLPRWTLEPSYASEITVEFDGAEGGAVWVHDSEADESIAIRGPEAMRELARMLNAFADGYTAPLEAKQ